MADTSKIPNPGSTEALDMGCRCPVIDNNHGRSPVYVDEHGQSQWWINEECPLHGSQAAVDALFKEGKAPCQ